MGGDEDERTHPALRRRTSLELRYVRRTRPAARFSINDFDETLPGPFEWDVKRLAASFAVAGRDRGFDLKTRASINPTVGRAYRESIRRFATMGNLALWYARVGAEEVAQQLLAVASAKQAKRFEANRAKALSKDSLKPIHP